MSMAEDTRKRPDLLTDSYPPKAKDPAGDPLAELARLIGQNDPFAEPTRASAQKPLDALRTDGRPAPEWLARPAPDRDESEYPEPRAPRDDYHAEQEPAPYEPQAQDYRQPDAALDARYAQERDHAEAAAYPAAQHDDTPYQVDDRYRVTPPPPGDYDPDAYYAEDGHMPPQHGEESAPNRRRGMMLTIAAVLGLAVIGTAGAFGYRAFTSGASAPANPPVIKADTTPAKIVPPPASADAQGNAQGKPFQDRIGAPGAPERVVSREEQPVSLPTPSRAPAPAGLAPAAPPPLVAPQPVTGANEPKRVKTMTIRPDADPTAATAPSAAPPSAPAAGAPRTAAPKQQGGPMPIAPQSDPSPRTKVASRPAAAAPAGAYVQVSAQRSEAEAQSSYRAMQQKYPAVLGSREASIRRADLGQAGVWYRAQIGPFTSAEQATAFCDNLKAAGGQCMVHRN